MLANVRVDVGFVCRSRRTLKIYLFLAGLEPAEIPSSIAHTRATRTCGRTLHRPKQSRRFHD